MNKADILQHLKILFVIAVGAFVVAAGFSLFQLPFNLAAGGVSGIGIMIRHFTGWPAGILILLMNVPLLILGYRQLGGMRFLIQTVAAVLVFSASTDFLTYCMPRILSPYPLTEDMLLSTIYAGLITGIGTGIIYRAGGSVGGTSVISRIVQRKTGFPLSQTYLVVDGSIILISGFVFSWDIALHALLVLFFCGIASDFALEGPAVVRTANIVTDRPRELAEVLMKELHRGVSIWEITGGYTGHKRGMVFCTINRAQVGELKQVVADVNPEAFMVIGDAHQALGSGFSPMRRRSHETSRKFAG